MSVSDDEDDMDVGKLKEAIVREDEDDISNIFYSQVEDANSLLTEPLFDELPVVNFICKNGTASPRILKFFLDNGADANLQSIEGTPLQIVSKYGTAKYIHTLLDYGAHLETPEEPVYHENSPFYLASMFGHVRVIEELYLYQPKLVKQDGVRTNLLYAACIGGNMDIIKQWYCPNMNINDPPYYCTEEFSMNKTPLYAACSGGHTDVVKYLVMELEAELTPLVCEEFPDIIGQFLGNCFEKIDMDISDTQDEEQEGYKGDFSRKGLGGFHESWIHPYTQTLVELDISYNKIKSLPDNIPWSLPNLRLLNAAHNTLTKFSVDKLQPVMCQKLERLLLERNLLEDLCDELFQLPELRELNISYNQLKYLVKTHQQQEDWRRMTNKKDRSEWNCQKLYKMLVSHNVLEMLPPDIRTCRNLTILDVSNNKLTTFPSPWECKLASLDVSHNELVRFPPSVEQYWCGTLKILKIHHNHLEELGESVFKLCIMTELDASHNSITSLPGPEFWDCKQLYLLDLSSNRLGLQHNIPLPSPRSHSKFPTPKRKKQSICQEEAATQIVFPAFLAHCLQELSLSKNKLDGVPPTVCDLSSLHLLDLSENPGIKKLPKALGKLNACKNLKLYGCDEKLLQELKFPTQATSTAKEREIFSKEVIQKLRNEYRHSSPYYRLKLVILGKKDKGKTTLSSKLGATLQDEMYGVGVRHSEVTLLPPRRNGRLRNLFQGSDSNCPPVTFCIWDMAGDEAYAATHHCFFTPNSLYLVVWDLWSLPSEMDKLGKLLYSIEASTPNSKVILAATFLDKNTSSQRKQEVQKIQQELLIRFGSTSEHYGGMCSHLSSDCVIPVSCTNGDGILELKRTLYEVALNMKDVRHRTPLLGRMIPQSYTKIQEHISTELEAREKLGWPPLLYQQEFSNFVSSVEDCDIDVNEELSKLVKFLQETGSILHYNDQLKGLNNMYFLDPTWLCDVLSKVLLDPEVRLHIRNGKVSLDAVQKVFLNDPRFPNELIEQCIQLLERFEIALKVDSGRKLFLPSTLARNPGIELHQQQQEGKDVCRLFQLAFIPNGFWSRLLPRIMSQLELLSEDWILRNSSTIRSVTRQIRNRTMYRIPSGTNSQGLKIERKNIVYWEDGMCLLPQDKENGYFMLQTVSITRDGYNTSGVLVTVHSNNEDYSIMGMIVDAIDDLLNDHFPGLMDYNALTGQPRVQRFAVCPVCFNSLSNMAHLPATLDHFTVEHCARLLLSADSIVCKTGVRVPLLQLVPELLMEELPKKFLLDKDKLTIFTEAFLGRGVAGSVFKGRYGDNVVAVKFYHGAPEVRGIGKAPSYGSKDSSYYTGERPGKKSISVEKGIKELAKDLQKKNQPPIEDEDTDEELHLTDYKNVDSISKSFDLDEAGSIKAWKAFMEMRQEVAVTSKLQHPCVVSFLGISVRPQLLICLELAPLGSLRDVLDSQVEGREPFNKYRDQGKIFSPVFMKDLNYKIVWQMAKGLEYLHKHGILYRDLKSDNILVNSLELDAPVNIKLSDLGISKFNMSGGAVGLVGTPGYQAPEIIEGLAYDEKVDIFSFAMVIHEILSGERPYVEYKNLAQISRAMRVESKRPSLKDYNIDARFPALEELMERCWHKEASSRPKASEMVSQDYLRSIQFVCQHKLFFRPDGSQHERIDCVAPIAEYESQTKQVWLWEGREDGRCYHVIDLTTCKYQVFKEWLPGAKVTCMAKIGKEVWVGNENEEIEIFGQKSFGNPTKLRNLENLGATPTFILYLEEDSKGGKKVYVSLSNGRLRIYTTKGDKAKILPSSTPLPSRTQEWHSLKTLQLTRGRKSASCMAYIPDKEELWIGCESEIVIVNDKSEMVEQRISVADAKKNFKEPKDPKVIQLVYNNGCVWALLKDSSVILEFDAELGILTHVITCDEQNPLNMAISHYISSHGSRPERIMEEIRDSSESGSGESLNDDELVRWLSTANVSDSESESDRSSKEAVKPVTGESWSPDKPPELPPKINRGISIEDKLQGKYLKNPKRGQGLHIKSDYEVPKKVDPSVPNLPPKGETKASRTMPPLPPKKRGVSKSTSSAESENRNSSPIDLPPALPDRPPPKSRTLPSLSRGFNSLKTITVKSIISVGDSLWLGRSCGDIVIVNMKSNSCRDSEHGHVVACMKPRCSDPSYDTEQEVKSLVLVGCLVVSLVLTDSKHSELSAWEAYDTHNISRIQNNYWSLKRGDKSGNRSSSPGRGVNSEILEMNEG